MPERELISQKNNDYAEPLKLGDQPLGGSEPKEPSKLWQKNLDLTKVHRSPAQASDFHQDLERTRRLSAVGRAAAESQAQARAKESTPWDEDHKNGARVYKMIGYTTSARVDRKFVLEARQRKLRKILVYVLALTIVGMILAINKPIKNIGEFKRILGIDSLFGTNE